MDYKEGKPFGKLRLSPSMLNRMYKLGYKTATPVQTGCIPPMMHWKDVIVKAPTGSGKTFAYSIPIIEHARAEIKTVQAVTLAPTRELALQIQDTLRHLAETNPGIRIVCLYGGQPIGKQLEQLKKHPQIIVATPGRLIDHLRRQSVQIHTAKTVVLDEADRMLDMGFVQDVTRLLDKMKHRKNLGMFSATLSREVMDISWKYQTNPVEINVQPEDDNKPAIQQFRMDVSSCGKTEAIERILKEIGFERCMVFCNTKGSTERICQFLQLQGVDADRIHGDIPQSQRERTMERFRQGKLRVLVATDVAARGIDVDDVDIVFNSDIPDENHEYIHRIGRTGRAKRQGVAVSLIGDYPSKLRLDALVKWLKIEIPAVTFGADGNLIPVSELSLK